MTMMWLLVVIACGGLVVVDRWLKLLAFSGVTRDFGFAHFLLFKNAALVFSWPAPNKIAVVLMIMAMAIVIFLARRMWRGRNINALIGCLFILTGAGSNLYDRLAYGYVVDWAYLGKWWPVFNVADVMIGVGLVMVIFLRSRLRTKTL